MPLINVRLIENVSAPEQKQQTMRDLTEAVAIDGEPVTTGAARALARSDLSLPV